MERSTGDLLNEAARGIEEATVRWEGGNGQSQIELMAQQELWHGTFKFD